MSVIGVRSWYIKPGGDPNVGKLRPIVHFPAGFWGTPITVACCPS